MLIRGFTYIIGVALVVSGGVNSIAYLNLLSVGLSFHEYVDFIRNRPECYTFVVGILMINISIFFPFKSSRDK